MSTRSRVGLCALGGAAGFLGWIGFGQPYLLCVFLVPVLRAIRDVTPRRAFLLGWVAGIVGHAGGSYWMGYVLEQFGGLHWTLAWLGMVGVGAYGGLSLALWAWATRRVHRDLGWPLGVAAPFLWVAVEHVYPFLFTPYAGAGLYPLLVLTQIVELTGPLGLSFLLVFLNGTAYEAWTARPLPWRQVAALLVVVAGTVAFGALRIPVIDARVAGAPKITVGVVQTNIGAAASHEDRRGFLRRHQIMSEELERAHAVDLVIWPENVCTLKGEGNLLPIRHEGEAPVLFGALTLREDGNHTSALLAGADGRLLGRYDKRDLLPFAEYVPLRDVLPFLANWSPHQGLYEAGSSTDPLRLDGKKLATSICYEDISPNVVRDGMERDPHALFNLTNDSWYGDTTEPLQHLVLASLRAIEHRRALVRATNTGISAIVDPVGRLVHRTPQWERATLVGEVPLLQGDRTLFGRLGHWFGWVCLAVVLCGFARRKMKSH